MPERSHQSFRVPERGEIYQVLLDPTVGHKQRGFRPVLVITQRFFNTCGTPIVCPIIHGGSYARYRGLAVELIGLKTDGIVLCHQLRALDLATRSAH